MPLFGLFSLSIAAMVLCVAASGRTRLSVLAIWAVTVGAHTLL